MVHRTDARRRVRAGARSFIVAAAAGIEPVHFGCHRLAPRPQSVGGTTSGARVVWLKWAATVILITLSVTVMVEGISGANVRRRSDLVMIDNRIRLLPTHCNHLFNIKLFYFLRLL
ncbi:hypothetical protein JYU34_016100 [Plutella xylostella]|uniref:Uncharacterized protein n=1 Tax=Plutella xylostella TaxID=51655 RepID=A0ABQ7Q5E6_PLUXY|nr:hypothetical protein JYU34_016100 [Plutella xylostella]